MSRQNFSHAVMAQRTEAANSSDDFPTPMWAVRAFMSEFMIPYDYFNSTQTIWEPCCGRLYMARALQEYTSQIVTTSDIIDYGKGQHGVQNYLEATPFKKPDWIITNPPFKLAEEFVLKALKETNRGVAILERTTWLDGIGRHARLFNPFPPDYIVQYAERVPMVKGRLDRKASTATAYAWFVWSKDTFRTDKGRVAWIAPSKKFYDKDEDWIV